MTDYGKAEPILYFEGFMDRQPGTPGIAYKRGTIDKCLDAFCDMLREAAASDSPNKFTEIERLARIGHQLVRTKSFTLEEFVRAGGKIENPNKEVGREPFMITDATPLAHVLAAGEPVALVSGNEINLLGPELPKDVTQGSEAMQSVGTPVNQVGLNVDAAQGADLPTERDVLLRRAETSAAGTDPREVPTVIVEGIREELKRLVAGSLEGNLTQIENVCARARELFMTLRGQGATFNRGRGPGVSTGPNVVGSYGLSSYGGAGMFEPLPMAQNPEQFGAKAIRELVALIPEMLSARSNSPESLMAAISLAKEKGHHEIAEQLTERLLGKKDKAVVVEAHASHEHVAVPAPKDVAPTVAHVCTNADVNETPGTNGAAHGGVGDFTTV